MHYLKVNGRSSSFQKESSKGWQSRKWPNGKKQASLLRKGDVLLVTRKRWMLPVCCSIEDGVILLAVSQTGRRCYSGKVPNSV